MIQRLSFAAVILALIFSSFSCAPGLEKPTATPTPEEAAPPPRELASTGDFSVAISSVQREEEKVILRFSITKVGDTNAGAQILPVTLIDDHGNEYKGELGIDLGLKEISEAQREVTEAAEEVKDPALREKLLKLNELTEGQKGELARELSKQFEVSTESILEWFEEVALKQGAVDILNAIPKGFTYIESLAISMPKIAPIDKVRLGGKETDFAKLKFGEPQYLKEFGSSSVAKGQKVEVGEWLSFTTGQIEPELHHWELPIEVGSTEYNPLPAEVKVGVQHEDGTISWTSPHSTDVPAASKSSVELSLPIPSWVNGGPPQPGTLLLIYRDKRGGEQALKMCAMTAGELPPLVGQGPKETEDIFIEAYQRNGGKKVMGNPLNLPHWFAGAEQPKDQHDLPVQEFPSVSEFGKSAIIWDKQGDTSKAYVLHGAIWDKYSSLGGPYYKVAQDVCLGAPTSELKRGTGDNVYLEFQHGFIATDSKICEVIPPPIGKIAFIIHNYGGPRADGTLIDSRRDLHVLDLRTNKANTILTQETLVSAVSDSLRTSSSLRWSTDGTRITFTTLKGIYEVNVTSGKVSSLTSNLQAFPYSRPAWSPDGSKIVFSAGTALYIMDADGGNKNRFFSRSTALSEGDLGGFGDLCWSPDGNRIALIGYEAYHHCPGIYVIDVATKNVQLVKELKAAGYWTGISWSPDGNNMLLTLAPNLSGRDWGTYTLDLTTGTLIQSCHDAQGGTWSPDGKWIAYAGVSELRNCKWGISKGTSIGGGRETGSLSWWAPHESIAPVLGTSTKADLVDALKDLREAMLKKIDSDIDNTAIAFTDVKDYWRSKRWADIFTAPLRILEDTLISLAKASDVKSLATEANTALNSSEATYQVLTTIMMLQDLQEVGEKLHYGLDGPTYISSIESMLEAADATFVPPFGNDWQKNYKVVIENHLYGITKDTPLIIPRKSTTLQRKNIEFVKGALQVRSSIATTFNDLIAEIESRELPEDFPIDEVIAQIEELKKQVIKSMGYSVEVEYKTDFQDPVNTNLGAVGSLYRAFGQIASRVAEKLEIEQRVEVFKLAETVESAALLYIIIYKIPDAGEIRIAQKATTLAELSVKPYENTFYSDPEEEFYMLPQEMVLTLPGELSNLWMMADDTDQYLRHLLAIP